MDVVTVFSQIALFDLCSEARGARASARARSKFLNSISTHQMEQIHFRVHVDIFKIEEFSAI